MVHSMQPTTTRRLEGKVVAGGQQTRRYLGWLLGLDQPGLPYNVAAVAWVDQEVKATIKLGQEKEATFILKRSTEQTRGVVVTPNLCLTHSGDELPKALVRRLERVAAARLGKVNLDALAERIAADPDIGNSGVALPGTADHDRRPRFLLDTWGEGDAYADFFAGGELARGQLDSLDPTGLFVFVQHSDSECNFVNPHGMAPVIPLVNFPWDERYRTRRRPASSKSAVEGGEMLTTDLTEHDVIMGSTEKIRKVLEKGVELSNRLGKTLFFSNTCVPTVTGEDVESLVKHCQNNCNCPMLYLTVTPRSMVNVFRDVLVTRRLAAEAKAPVCQEPVVNLIGLPENESHADLAELLQAAGIRINVTLVPNLEVTRVERFGEAALNVYQLNTTWQHLYDQMLTDTRLPSVTPPPPYGFEGTREWLEAVSNALPNPESRPVNEVYERYVAPLRKRFDSLREEAGGYRLGMVLRAKETHYLSAPGHTWGVPLVKLLEEMGYSLDILVLMESRDQAAKAGRNIAATFGHPERHSVKGFNSLEMLLERLRTSPANAFLTYHFYDWRITQGGKNLFSLQHMEPGPLGALRTLERINSICRTTFFRNYGKYLQRTPEGLRLQHEEVTLP